MSSFNDAMKAEIKDAMSPQAAALVEIVGGPDAMNALYEEVGV